VLVTHDDMNHIVGELWSTVFGMGINPTAPAPFDGRVITATVSMTGECAASVVVRCGDQLAEQLAAKALGLDESALVADDLHDTVGEVANILAGNVKAMLGGQLRLSLPAVTDGAAELVEVGRDDVVQDDHFVCNGRHVAITSKRQPV
jgi:chemotaxis protein CheX